MRYLKMINTAQEQCSQHFSWLSFGSSDKAAVVYCLHLCKSFGLSLIIKGRGLLAQVIFEELC